MKAVGDFSRRAAFALFGAVIAIVCTTPGAIAQSDPLAAMISAAHRAPNNSARDKFRKPYEVIKFFGITDTSRVVEILPGSTGYFTEILAPYLRDKGLYITAGRHEGAPQNYTEDHKRMLAKYAANPDVFGKIAVTRFFKNDYEIAPPGSMDFVLTFRNLHNWIERKEIDDALKSFHAALKPGGILGVTDHRARTDQPQDEQMKKGYIRQDYAIAVIERAGFQFIGSSEVKANPKDTKDYPEGVWSLPPTYRQKDVDRAKYEAIGESDRFVLKFVKR